MTRKLTEKEITHYLYELQDTDHTIDSRENIIHESKIINAIGNPFELEMIIDRCTDRHGKVSISHLLDELLSPENKHTPISKTYFTKDSMAHAIPIQDEVKNE